VVVVLEALLQVVVELAVIELLQVFLFQLQQVIQ
jgi:hypothetical protein